MPRLVLAALLATAVAVPAAAQHDAAAHAGHTAVPGVPTALSAEEAAGLDAGRGLGMARPAELHGYPGPLHVLELADALALTDRQRTVAERLRAEMLAEAVPLGRQLVEVEGHLDALFASGTATSDAVERVTAHAGQLRGRLRAAHLRAHLAMRDALAPDQIETYDRLRGYAD